jgi:hypothetical protein
MDTATWLEVQEGLLLTFGPVLFWFLAIIVTGGVLSAIGVVILEMVSNMTR